MKKSSLLVFCICVALSALVAPSEAHIHSHKVKHYEQERVTVHTWIYSLLSSAAVGACGVFPLIVNRWIKLDSGCKDKPAFRTLLSFAVGGLLGDVFLHLLPEAWGAHDREVGISLGLWVTVGLLSFMLVEKVVKLTEEATSDKDDTKCPTSESTMEKVPEIIAANSSASMYTSANGSSYSGNGCLKNGLRKNGCGSPKMKNGCINRKNNTTHLLNGTTRSLNGLVNGVSMPSLTHAPPRDDCRYYAQEKGAEFDRVVSQYDQDKHKPSLPASMQSESDGSESSSSWLQKDISGYLNLVANCTDNFTHGLAIATSYVANPAVGLLTTLAILCHEIPHEIGDFAILLNSGFNLREAAKAQITTACGGLVGVVAGLTAEHLSNASDWLLPFTAGGFLYIALISIIPDLLQDSAKISFKQTVIEMVAIVTGIIVMALVTIVEKKSCGHMPLHLKH